MYELSALGFSPFFEKQLKAPLPGEAVPARIAAEHRGGYEVWSSAGAGQAQLAGRLREQLEGQALPGVGDWVVLRGAPDPDGVSVIDRVLGRRTVFLRAAAGRATGEQVIAANLDLVFVVCGLDADYNPRRIERYLALILASGARPEVILNKADVGRDVDVRLSEVEARAGGAPVHLTSALRAEGLEAVRGRIEPGMTAALVGSSGAGKSTMVNALCGEQLMATGEVRASDGRGCHVTSHRQLVLLPGGGLLLDTPGMRELQLCDDEGLNAVFDDIAELAAGCRFRDCRHHDEPGCAVRQAVAEGQLDADRLEHLHKLEKEARAFEIRHDARLRRKSGRVWGQLYDEASRLRRWKEGD